MEKFKRRTFIKTGILAGGAVIFTRQLSANGLLSNSPLGMKPPAPGEMPDIVTISSDDPEANIPKLLQPLGGISAFVKTGQKVGILANSPWKNPGYFTNPDIVLVIAGLCMGAGAKNVICLKPANQAYWEKGKLFGKYRTTIEGITYGTDRVQVDIPGGISLKQADIYKELQDVDVFISIPVAKHHNGVVYSGNLKGMMGASSSDTNRQMHSPDGNYTYDEREWLAQCIADLSIIRKPDLCIIDAMECATNNGPAGPGNTVKPGKIIAGKDPLATDVFAAGLIGFDRDEILTFDRAYKHKIGETDLSKLTLLEL
jgi:uncharacterized protein (DUF362 family)